MQDLSQPANSNSASTAATPTTVPVVSGDTLTLSDPRAEYLQATAAALRDLPAVEREELLEDLAAHLSEIAVDEGEAFTNRLGAPADYAREFRASAGYPPEVITDQSGHPLSHNLGRVRAACRVNAAKTRDALAALPGAPALMAFWPRLRPGWWVLRGALAGLCVIALLTPVWAEHPMWRLLVTSLISVVVSVAWGQRTERLGRTAPRAERLTLGILNVIAWICLPGMLGVGPAAPLGVRAWNQPGQNVYEPTPTPITAGLLLDGEAVTNLAIYDAAGRLIPLAQVFDQNGRPITVSDDTVFSDAGQIVRVPAYDREGNELPNVYPLVRVVAIPDVAENGEMTGTATITQILRPNKIASQTGVQPPSVPPVGSVVPMNQEEGTLNLDQATLPDDASNSGTPDPTPSPTGNSKGSKESHKE